MDIGAVIIFSNFRDFNSVFAAFPFTLSYGTLQKQSLDSSSQQSIDAEWPHNMKDKFKAIICPFLYRNFVLHIIIILLIKNIIFSM